MRILLETESTADSIVACPAAVWWTDEKDIRRYIRLSKIVREEDDDEFSIHLRGITLFAHSCVPADDMYDISALEDLQSAKEEFGVNSDSLITEEYFRAEINAGTIEFIMCSDGYGGGDMVNMKFVKISELETLLEMKLEDAAMHLEDEESPLVSGYAKYLLTKGG